MTRSVPYSVCLNVYLHGKPGQELAEGEPVTAEEIADYGIDLGARLTKLAADVKKLEDEGWTATMGLFDVTLEPDEATNRRAVRALLKRLEIDPRVFVMRDMEMEVEA